MRHGGSCSRGGHSGGGNGSDEERKRKKRAPDPVRAGLVASDGGRKRGARAYTNWGREAPPAYARREVEEYDRRMEMTAAAAAARGTGTRRCEPGSSSGAGSSAIARAPLPPVKREEEEQQGAAPRAGRGLLPGDFVDDGDLDWVTAELMERTKDEQQQLEADREMKRELYEYKPSRNPRPTSHGAPPTPTLTPAERRRRLVAAAPLGLR